MDKMFQWLEAQAYYWFLDGNQILVDPNDQE